MNLATTFIWTPICALVCAIGCSDDETDCDLADAWQRLEPEIHPRPCTPAIAPQALSSSHGTCDPTAGDDTCVTCAKAACCSASVACFADAMCSCLLPPSQCTAPPDPAYLTLASCITTHCAAQCPVFP